MSLVIPVAAMPASGRGATECYESSSTPQLTNLAMLRKYWQRLVIGAWNVTST